MLTLIEGEIGNAELLDGWVPFKNRIGGRGALRAFPPRLIHVLAGNAPGVAALSIIRGAITKGVNLLKLPSNDFFTSAAILRALAAVAPGHPVARSFSAVYWRGGDTAVESAIFRPQYFDKLVAWGGESAIRSAKNYIGPGFELVAFDPKTSISMIGKEALASPEWIADSAERAASDSTSYNQAACIAARFHYVEAENEEAVDRYCAELQKRMGVERRTCSEFGPKVSTELRDEIETLKSFGSLYRVFGDYDGKGLVIRSDEPLDIYPDGKIVNVVRVPSLAHATRYATVATQTVGVYPPERKAELRNALASAGVQRVVTLGGAEGMVAGMSHDGFFPLHRMVRWVNDEG
jgi:Acyl-CoA reductase (LuxC)